MPYCGADTDASVICNHVIVSINSPASANGTIQFQVTARSPVAGVDMSGNEYIFTDGNAGAANSYNLVVNSGSDEPIFYVYDSAGVSRYVTPNVSNWAADTDYTLEAYADGNGNLGLYWNSAWDESESGAGTGKRSASQTTLYLGGTNSAGENFWIRDFVVYRRILR
jgi:hypothetical protein